MYDTDLPIRSDLREAHATVVDRWSRPGTWWTAQERLAIVAEVRRARDAAEAPPAWVRASQVNGSVSGEHSLPAAAIDVIWRLTNHSGTLTAEWCDAAIDGFGEPSDAITPGQYTELVALVAQTNCIDRFAEGLSLDRPTLGGPVAGEPSRTVPEDAAMRGHWVPTVPSDYPAVVQALSAVPAENAAMLLLSDAQYIPVDEMFDLTSDRNSLSRMQVELVAARTSVLNECFY
ncbi:MAG: alkylhydroperoxidase-related (seleno)protein [Acidimicrobiaceae bacterium]|nr:alkylhydroperoxidase-related (seleno)protein [Acidimicrobiaceae bacterium]